jgi:hypothetical protein
MATSPAATAGAKMCDNSRLPFQSEYCIDVFRLCRYDGALQWLGFRLRHSNGSGDYFSP